MRQQKSQCCRGSQASTSSYLSRTDISAQYSVQCSCPYSSLIYSREPPIVLHSIEALLLTVGQRVRKAIPKGYKIKPRNDLTISKVSQYPRVISSISTPVKKRARMAISNSCSSPVSAQRELMPLCGLPKEGNQIQPWDFDDQFTTEQCAEESNININIPFLCCHNSTASSSSVSSVMEISKGYTSEDDNYLSWCFTAEDIHTENEGQAIIFYQTDQNTAKKPAKPSENAYDFVDFEDADFLDYGALMSAREHMIT